MSRYTFSCIDAHTCGNPVRVIREGDIPELRGDSMSAKRQDFLNNHDWIRLALMFEPRGHDIMSGSIIYPPLTQGSDAAILFIETSGCLPMCGHGLIGTVTVAIEHGLITPATEGQLILDVPAGKVTVSYVREGDKVTSVRIRNVGSYLAEEGVEVDCPGLGTLRLDISYGGNFYGIVEPQENFAGLEHFGAENVLRYSPVLRKAINQKITVVHPEDSTVSGTSHILWTGTPSEGADGRNAVFYGDRAIDRSPCGTGTSARMAQLFAHGQLGVGDRFVHESIIGSRFNGRVEAETRVGPHSGIIPSIEGAAHVIGLNTIFVDEDEPFPTGFQVT